MKTRRVFKLREGESRIQQGDNEVFINGTGRYTYLWIGGKGCYGHLSGAKTLENLAHSILHALKQKTS